MPTETENAVLIEVDQVKLPTIDEPSQESAKASNDDIPKVKNLAQSAYHNKMFWICTIIFRYAGIFSNKTKRTIFYYYC